MSLRWWTGIKFRERNEVEYLDDNSITHHQHALVKDAVSWRSIDAHQRTNSNGTHQPRRCFPVLTTTSVILPPKYL